MDKALYDKGMQMRRKVLGDEYVDRAVANTDDFNRQFQELLTTYCWGAVWGDEELSAILRQIAVYCGFPAAVDAHRIAKQVLAAEAGKKG